MLFRSEELGGDRHLVECRGGAVQGDGEERPRLELLLALLDAASAAPTRRGSEPDTLPAICGHNKQTDASGTSPSSTFSGSLYCVQHTLCVASTSMPHISRAIMQAILSSSGPRTGQTKPSSHPGLFHTNYDVRQQARKVHGPRTTHEHTEIIRSLVRDAFAITCTSHRPSSGSSTNTR